MVNNQYHAELPYRKHVRPSAACLPTYVPDEIKSKYFYTLTDMQSVNIG